MAAKILPKSTSGTHMESSKTPSQQIIYSEAKVLAWLHHAKAKNTSKLYSNCNIASKIKVCLAHCYQVNLAHLVGTQKLPKTSSMTKENHLGQCVHLLSHLYEQKHLHNGRACSRTTLKSVCVATIYNSFEQFVLCKKAPMHTSEIDHTSRIILPRMSRKSVKTTRTACKTQFAVLICLFPKF